MFKLRNFTSIYGTCVGQSWVCLLPDEDAGEQETLHQLVKPVHSSPGRDMRGHSCSITGFLKKVLFYKPLEIFSMQYSGLEEAVDF